MPRTYCEGIYRNGQHKPHEIDRAEAYEVRFSGKLFPTVLCAPCIVRLGGKVPAEAVDK